MIEEGFVFDNQEFRLQKDESRWILSVKRSDVAVQDLSQLLMLDLHHGLFLDQKMTVDEDSVHFTYQLEPFGQDFATIKTASMAEKLRFALNVVGLRAGLHLPVSFVLHPANVFITKDCQPRIAYRAIPEAMVPGRLDSESFLKQLKSYLFALFTDYDFMDLYNGALDVVAVPEFLETIRQEESIEELENHLQTFYQEKSQEEKATLSLVKTGKFRLYRYATIWRGSRSSS